MTIRLHDREVIRRRFAGRESLHVYELGDLDDFFFPRCSYFAHEKDPRATVLLYEGAEPKTLLAIDQGPNSRLEELIASLIDVLPSRMYAHLTLGLMESLAPHYDVRPEGAYWKMARAKGAALEHVPLADQCVRVMPADRSAAIRFYEESYPGTWFEPSMLETGMYYALVENGRYVAMAGVHVVSSKFKAAALGNVATHPSHRGKGLARATCACVLQALQGVADYVGLNVAQDNAAAIACYRSLGFEILAHYDEATLTRKPSPR